MFYNLKKFLKKLKAAGISVQQSNTGKYDGDYYVPQGKITPHLHCSSDGNFVGVKNKQGAIKTLVYKGVPNPQTIAEAIAELVGSTVQSEIIVLDALNQLNAHIVDGL